MRYHGAMDWLRLLDDVRAAEHNRSRTTERRLRVVAEESATLHGSLVDLAERGTSVRVTTSSGRRHVGPLQLVGHDFLVVADVWVSLQAVASVGAAPGAPAAAGDRPAVDLLLVEALARLVADRHDVAVVTVGGDVVAGQLRAVGADVLSIRLGGDGGMAYVPSASVLEVAFRAG